MKKIFVFVVIILSLSYINVQAEEDTTCSYASKAALSKAAYNVEHNYTIKKDESGRYYVEISIYNITDEIYIIITNESTHEDTQVLSTMTKGNTYTFQDIENVSINNYTIHVRSFKYGCSDELRKFTITKPRYNDLSELDICKENEMIDYSYCQTWVNKYFTETREEIIEKLNHRYEKEKPTITTKCIKCENEKINNQKLKKANNIRLAIIIGLIVGILIDIALIIYLIVRLRSYEI